MSVLPPDSDSEPGRVDQGSVEITVLPCSALTSRLRQEVFDLFHGAYRGANDSYLEESLTVFGHIGLAKAHDRVVAFALGATRLLDIPRVGLCRVSMAGIACVHRSWRRRHLFVELATAALGGDEVEERHGLHLATGRVAHPASYRSFALPNAIPRPGVELTAWHKEVGTSVAAAYGSRDFDENHFVCRGDWAGPGEPALEIETATADEHDLFAFVNRARGDSLLVVGWFPEAPTGWLSVQG